MTIRPTPRLCAARAILWVALILIGTALHAAPTGDAPTDPSASFFASGKIPQIRITIDPGEVEKLREESRPYVKATIREDDRVTYEGVGVKLKGAAGSFRDWDDRPALTLNMGKFARGGRFHGLAKFHLNNSVQDETYLNESLGSELFRLAGVPAPRVTHARVWLNGRDVGLYALKEGFDKPFLARSFPDPTGNLYEGGFVQDIDADLEKDEGSGPDDRSDLRAIVQAASDTDPSARWRRMGTRLDLDSFATFMALERMLGHWDGYCDSANNYRLYFDPKRGKAVFLPHGMDQILNDPEAGLYEVSDRIAAVPFSQSDRLRALYRRRVESLVPLMAPPDGLLKHVDEVTSRLQPVLKGIDPEQAASHLQKVAELKERITARSASLVRQVAEPEPGLQEFDGRGETALAGWWSASENEAASLAEIDTEAGSKALQIRASGKEPCLASWRLHVLLGPGEYTLRGAVRTRDVGKLDGDEPGGAGLGVSGEPRAQNLLGTNEPRVLVHRFTVREDRRRIELVLELRASAGEAVFDLDSLSLKREPAPKAR